jgi:hypothetical protein
MSMVDSLPDRVLTRTELQAIQQAGDYDLVQPVEWHANEGSSPESETAELMVIVADHWFKVLNLCSNCGSWHLALDGGRPEHSDPQTCYHLAVSELQQPINPE